MGCCGASSQHLSKRGRRGCFFQSQRWWGQGVRGLCEERKERRAVFFAKCWADSWHFCCRVCCSKDWPSDHHHQKLRFTLSDGKARRERKWYCTPFLRYPNEGQKTAALWRIAIARLFDKDNFFAGLEVLLLWISRDLPSISLNFQPWGLEATNHWVSEAWRRGTRRWRGPGNVWSLVWCNHLWFLVKGNLRWGGNSIKAEGLHSLRLGSLSEVWRQMRQMRQRLRLVFLAATLHICPRSAIQYLLFHCLPTCYVGWCSSQLMRFTFQAMDEPFLLEIVSNPEGGFLLFVVALSMVAVQPVWFSEAWNQGNPVEWRVWMSVVWGHWLRGLLWNGARWWLLWSATWPRSLVAVQAHRWSMSRLTAQKISRVFRRCGWGFRKANNHDLAAGIPDATTAITIVAMGTSLSEPRISTKKVAHFCSQDTSWCSSWGQTPLHPWPLPPKMTLQTLGLAKKNATFKFVGGLNIHRNCRVLLPFRIHPLSMPEPWRLIEVDITFRTGTEMDSRIIRQSTWWIFCWFITGDWKQFCECLPGHWYSLVGSCHLLGFSFRGQNLSQPRVKKSANPGGIGKGHAGRLEDKIYCRAA